MTCFELQINTALLYVCVVIIVFAFANGLAALLGADDRRIFSAG